jgi:hypothetical protein
MFPLTHLSLKIFPIGTAFDVIFIDSPIFNRTIVNGDSNMIWCKYSKPQLIPTEVIDRNCDVLPLSLDDLLNYTTLMLKFCTNKWIWALLLRQVVFRGGKGCILPQKRM